MEKDEWRGIWRRMERDVGKEYWRGIWIEAGKRMNGDAYG